ncbi:MAG: S66 peptidase family protein [Dysgonomonas sp.]
MDNFIIPQYLKKGDKVVIVSPAGYTERKYIDGAASTLSDWGLNVIIAPHATGQNGRFSGTVEERLSDLQNAMDDPDTKMILCSRGGYGAVHLIEKLDFKNIRKYPKWFVGYSDITLLHQLFRHNGIMSIHAPMAKHLSENGDDDFCKAFKQTLFGNAFEYTLPSSPLNRKGATEGMLIGGNLAVLCSLMGSDYMRIPEGSILFIEDIAEKAYKIDRMIWTLKLAGVFDRIGGLIVGEFIDCEEDTSMYHSIYGSIKDVVEKYNFPVAFNFPIGHSERNSPVVHAANYRLQVSGNTVFLKNLSL